MKKFLVADDLGQGWAVYNGDPAFDSLTALKKMGYDLERTPIPREILLGRLCNIPIISMQNELDLEELEARLPDFVRRRQLYNPDTVV